MSRATRSSWGLLVGLAAYATTQGFSGEHSHGVAAALDTHAPGDTVMTVNRGAGDELWDSPEMPVRPNHNYVAAHPALIPKLVQDGRLIFKAKFTKLDGAGRPGATGDSKPTPRVPIQGADFVRTAGPDASACASCHNQPEIGGSGDFAANVFVGAHFSDPPTRRIDLAVTSERNTVGLFGSGLVELLALEMTRELQAQRAFALKEAAARHAPVRAKLTAKGVSFGELVALTDGTIDAGELSGVDYDLVVRPFGAKGVAVSLREFTIAALNQHHGMQAIERFGWERTGVKDFDGDGVAEEISVGQLTALVVFQAQLPAPPQRWSPNTQLRVVEQRGQAVFRAVHCQRCHIPEMALGTTVFSEPNPFNRPGAIIPRDVDGVIKIDLAGSNRAERVRAYTDLKRHNLCDTEIRHFCNEVRRQDNIAPGLFLTAKLWDAATSAPYGHRGDLGSLSEAILAHGGEARAEREAFLRLPTSDKRAVVSFLKTLGREP